MRSSAVVMLSEAPPPRLIAIEVGANSGRAMRKVSFVVFVDACEADHGTELAEVELVTGLELSDTESRHCLFIGLIAHGECCFFSCVFVADTFFSYHKIRHEVAPS